MIPERFWGQTGAGVLPIARSTHRILVGLRSGLVDQPYTWGVFGGKMDPGETPKEAALREMHEEAGRCKNIELSLGYVFKSGDFRYYNFIGLVDEEFTPILDRETEGAKWITWEELLKLKDKHFGLAAFLRHREDLIKQFTEPGRTNRNPRFSPRGECFKWALRDAVYNGGMLIHGWYLNPILLDHYIAHAWVERDGKIYDWQRCDQNMCEGGPVEIEEFYETYRPQHIVKYPGNPRLVGKAYEEGHYGPWHPAPWADPDWKGWEL